MIERHVGVRALVVNVIC